MGRKKIKIKPIEDKKLRQITYCKRKKGLLKKTMELSLLCKTQVFLAFVDHHNNLVIYNSEGHIANFVDKYLKFPVNPKETYCNQDVCINYFY